MKVIATKQFEKDIEKELSKATQLKLAEIIEELLLAASLDKIPGVKKLKGYKIAYRIRMGEFRIGFILEANTIKLSRVINRKEIYRYFP
jgi:mRNA interferase RelE/StbE